MSVNRRVLLTTGAAGVATLVAASRGMVALASPVSAAARNIVRSQDDATPEAMPMASPMPGPQADGSMLWKVMVGGMDMENAIEYHGFFPGEITINAGDSIWFAYDMPMFHTVTFPGPGDVPPIFIPDPEATAPATPSPLPKLIYNPIMFTGAGEGVVDGSQLVSSPNDVFSDQSIPWIFTFPAAGEYDYFCIPHASVMQGKVIVQEAGSALPADQAAYDQIAADAIAALQAEGLAQIEQFSTPAQTEKEGGGTLWEVATGAGGFSQVRVQRFLPGEITIAVGDSINFVIHSEGEPHTATLVGAGEEPPPDIIEETFADGFPKLVQNMETFLPSESATWSGTGFVNSGFMGIPALGLPMEFEILFDTPGDYIVYCILHGDPEGNRMAGRVTVA
ncbi:MAG: plastocyanin/azurin family copper-binding protein [Thermomicrobiales bacterium]